MKKNYKKLLAVLYGLYFMLVSSFATAQTIDYEWGFATGPSGTSNESTTGICFDVDGNMYVTGTFRGTVDFDPSPTVTPLYAVNSSFQSIENTFILKFDSDSTLIWAKQFGADINLGWDITYDGDQSLYIVGQTAPDTDFDTGTGTALSGQSNGGLYLCKIDTAGDFQWVGYGTNGNSLELNHVEYDALNDQVVVMGTHNGNDSDLYSESSSGSITVVNNGGQDILYATYSSAGSILNAGSIGGSGTEIGFDMDVDSQGNIFLAGRFQGTADLDPSANTDNYTAGGTVDGFITKLDNTGSYIGSAIFEGSDNEQISSITVDDNDSLYISGSYNGNASLGSAWGYTTPENFTTIGSYDAMIMKTSNDFQVAWNKVLGDASATGSEYINHLDYLNGTLYFGGTSNSTSLDFDLGTGTFSPAGAGNFDVFTAVYDQQANFIDAVRFGGNDRDIIEAMSIRSDGTIAIGGYYQSGNIDLDPTSGIDQYSNQGGGGSANNRDLFFSQMSFCGSTVDITTSDDGTTITANENAAGASYQWIDCSDDSEISGETTASYTPTVSGDYACIISNGCAVDTSDCVSITVTTTSLSEFSIESVSMYPNPSANKVSIQGLEKIDKVEITSVTGRAMSVSLQSEKEINILNYPSGIYFVKIYSEGQVITKKLIKK